MSGTTCNVNLLTDEHKKGKGTQDIKTAKSWWIQKIYGVRDSFSVYEESCWSKEAESKKEVWTTLSDSRFPLTLWTTIPQRVIKHLVAHFRCFLVFGNTGLTLQTPSAAVFFFFVFVFAHCAYALGMSIVSGAVKCYAKVNDVIQVLTAVKARFSLQHLVALNRGICYTLNTACNQLCK